MQDLSFFFRTLADRKRLRITQYLAHQEGVTVSQLGIELRLSQPLISWHLRALRRAGIVRTRRVGRQVFCSLDRPGMLTYMRVIDEVFNLHREVERDEEIEAPLDHQSGVRSKGEELCQKSG